MPTQTTARPNDAQVNTVREQLAAVPALDNQADEQIPPQRCYIAGTLAGIN